MSDETAFIPALDDPVPVAPAPSDVDLSDYRELGKVPWERRLEKLRQDFPYIDQVDWGVAFKDDVDLFGRIVRDILKLGQATPGRPGPRPGLDVQRAEKEVRKLFGQDHTVEPFKKALSALAPFLSVRQIAAKAQLERTNLHRILKGEKEVDAYTLRACAYAFGKHPSYFSEWRTYYITAALIRRLEWNPESSIRLYHMLDEQLKQRKTA